MSTLRRSQILFEPKQSQELAEIGHGSGRSMSEVVRDIVPQAFLEERAGASAEREAPEALERLT